MKRGHAYVWHDLVSYCFKSSDFILQNRNVGKCSFFKFVVFGIGYGFQPFI